MGYVTVLVQHAWALQPTPQADSQSARVKCEKRETTNVGSNRRLNRPFDIEYINNLLTKLRVDPSETTVKRAWTAYASLEKVLRSDLSSKCNTANVTRDTVLTSLRKSSRRSMLALAHCPIIPLRCRALRCLLYELNDVRVASNICDVSALAELVKQWFSLQATVDDNDVGFDTEQQRQILMILSLLLEQLEYALSNRSKVIVPISEEFRSLLETHLVGNTWVHAAHDDLYLRNLSCIIQDTVGSWLYVEKRF
ncbi:hypothetical protein DFS34DRAFT_219289 [Phlyctochytrium arcticum]|nr:hypothetical protein DFS34DRAFT_219289 [Phlyctochytrium arcticum]